MVRTWPTTTNQKCSSRTDADSGATDRLCPKVCLPAPHLALRPSLTRLRQLWRRASRCPSLFRPCRAAAPPRLLHRPSPTGVAELHVGRRGTLAALRVLQKGVRRCFAGQGRLCSRRLFFLAFPSWWPQHTKAHQRTTKNYIKDIQPFALIFFVFCCALMCAASQGRRRPQCDTNSRTAAHISPRLRSSSLAPALR